MHDPIGAEPFKVEVPEAVLTDLKDRLGRIRWPIEAKAPPWTYGASLDYMKTICAYWRDKYDWRKSEAQLNRWPQYKVTLGGKKVHFIMEKGSILTAFSRLHFNTQVDFGPVFIASPVLTNAPSFAVTHSPAPPF